MDFEVVVGREEPDRCVERGVIEDLGRDLGYCPAACATWFGGYCEAGSVGTSGDSARGTYIVLNHHLLCQGSPSVGGVPWPCAYQRSASVVALQLGEQALERVVYAGAASHPTRGYLRKPLRNAEGGEETVARQWPTKDN